MTTAGKHGVRSGRDRNYRGHRNGSLRWSCFELKRMGARYVCSRTAGGVQKVYDVEEKNRGGLNIVILVSNAFRN